MEIASGVYSMGQLEGQAAHLSGHVHAFLLDDGAELTLIDTLYDTDAQIILDQLRRMGRAVTELKRIVLTHAHRSHLGGLATLKRLSGATIYAHEWEADIIAGDRKAQGCTMRPMQPLSLYPLQLGLALGFGAHPPCPIERVLKDGDRIGPLQVLHVPGHSPGHLAFYWPERRLLIAGDNIATWPRFDAGWPAFHLNLKQLRTSLRQMAQLDAQVIAVGHGAPITAGARDRIRFLVERLDR